METEQTRVAHVKQWQQGWEGYSVVPQESHYYAFLYQQRRRYCDDGLAEIPREGVVVVETSDPPRECFRSSWLLEEVEVAPL